ncbi:hypothetical protein IW261DRAFT_785619 [Armillaria novae-zelandiae]|uniref:Uncharacterized protein n=1 Tax=Armillaria novae-zelandiae TaxID=153914 RepID=A0AA39UNN6_9AGAR|nr:hypothetical protein IW261DRAFT_785619 [Armillaria novae-zelandiae]
MSVEAFSKPCGGAALVKSDCVTIYDFTSDESLFASIDTYLVDATWVPKMSWENDTSVEQTYSLQYTTGLRVTKGTEVTNLVAIAAEFTGLSMSVDGETKTFTTYETTGTLTKTITLSVPPKSTLTFYQKKYRFKDTMFFILNAWGYDWNVGSPGGHGITRKECEVEIMSGDHLVVDVLLGDAAAGIMEVECVSKADSETARQTRERGEITKRAKDELSKMGV